MTKQQNAVLMLIIMSSFLVLLRVQITQSLIFSFMLWNLFLAIIPYVISEYLKLYKMKRYIKIKTAVTIVLCVLFLPNAPYMITDLIHLNTKSPMAWYDLLLLFCCATTGLLLTVLTIINIKHTAIAAWRIKAGFLIPLICFLCGFGVYLGRFLRFNSWDIITSPISLVKRSIQTIQQAEVWSFTIGFGMFIWLVITFYSSLYETKH